MQNKSISTVHKKEGFPYFPLLIKGHIKHVKCYKKLKIITTLVL
jgi:hypothetical protein